MLEQGVLGRAGFYHHDAPARYAVELYQSLPDNRDGHVVERQTDAHDVKGAFPDGQAGRIGDSPTQARVAVPGCGHLDTVKDVIDTNGPMPGSGKRRRLIPDARGNVQHRVPRPGVCLADHQRADTLPLVVDGFPPRVLICGVKPDEMVRVRPTPLPAALPFDPDGLGNQAPEAQREEGHESKNPRGKVKRKLRQCAAQEEKGLPRPDDEE
jgi:hypothetical protein